MQYRNLGKTGLKVSALALGCMRFDPNNPELAEQIVDTAIAAGVNYFETTRGYIAGKCQHLTAPGLKGRSRGLIVSGKTGINAETTADSYRAEIDLQMQILGVDYLEFYQVGWFSLAMMEFLTKKGGALEALDKARSEGLIGHIGFTGHDLPENFTKCIETGIFDSFTVPYNMLNRAYAPTIKRAGALGVGVIAMCPVAGGMLASPSPQLQQFISGGAKTTADAALRFVLTNPDISTACSGMNTLEMLRENLETANNFHGANAEDFRRMDAILDELHSLGERFCTMCGYCKECPQGVDIPGNFHLYNLGKVYGMTDWARAQYAAKEAGKRADACIQCGKCEPKCPNNLPIMKQLAKVTKTLG
ncbi:MAG: aldo/keto reductase [Lentisphaerae bacterium]|nr:aldo/keto reductase [Lentisphaerota bacterium]